MLEFRRTRGMWVGKAVGIAALGVLAVAVLGWVVMTLWNLLIPGLFGLHPLHFWQAMGLLVLCRLLFGGFHRGHGRGFHRRHHMMQRWESMTPEEREKFRQGVRGRFCGCREEGKD